MPELPEVETVCLALKPVIEGQSFTEIRLNRPDLRYPFPTNLASAVTGTKVLRVSRRAKYLLINFDNGQTLIWHLGMSGRVIIENRDAPLLQPESSPGNPAGNSAGIHDHVIFTTAHNYKITYRDPRRFGFLLLSPTAQLNAFKGFARLGPEPLPEPGGEPHINAEEFHDRLKGQQRCIKSTLLDQNIIAGLGNIYVSEALWQAKISPFRAAKSLTLQETGTLLEEIQDVLKRAIAAGGSTLRDHVQPDGTSGHFQHYFKVYSRENTLCGQCRINSITRVVQNGRATYYCRYCQR